MAEVPSVKGPELALILDALNTTPFENAREMLHVVKLIGIRSINTPILVHDKLTLQRQPLRRKRIVNGPVRAACAGGGHRCRYRCPRATAVRTQRQNFFPQLTGACDAGYRSARAAGGHGRICLDGRWRTRGTLYTRTLSTHITLNAMHSDGNDGLHMLQHSTAYLSTLPDFAHDCRARA